MRTVRVVPTTVSGQSPLAATIPTPAVTQSAAAEVSPLTRSVPPRCRWRMSPAHRNPMPVATPWITRVVSGEPLLMGMSTNSAVPRLTSMCVRRPAGRPVRCRSQPIAAPATTAAPSRRRMSSHPSSMATG